MLEAIILLLAIAIVLPKGKRHRRRTVGFQVSRGDYNSHLDFLEMHGAMSSEERQAQRELEDDYRKNPHKYKTMTLEEWMKEQNDSSGRKAIHNDSV